VLIYIAWLVVGRIYGSEFCQCTWLTYYIGFNIFKTGDQLLTFPWSWRFNMLTSLLCNLKIYAQLFK